MKSAVKRFIYVIGILILTSLGGLAQEKLNKAECDFLGPLNFKNNKAIVVIKVTYSEFNRSGDEPIFATLAKKKKLRFSDYFSRCCGGSEIRFKPENCSKEYSGVLLHKKMNFNINKAKSGDTLYLTCLVYQGEKSYDNIPFFTVINIRDSL